MMRVVEVKNTAYNYQIGKLTVKKDHFFPADFY